MMMSLIIAISADVSLDFVIISLTKSIFGFGTAIYKILCGAISSSAVAISVNFNNFQLLLENGLNTLLGVQTNERFILPRRTKSSLLKFKFLIFTDATS